jgi:hypothetical protein
MVIFLLGMCREAGIPTLDVPRQWMSGAPAVPMIKGKFGGKLWSRSGTGQVNEALCKVGTLQGALPQHVRCRPEHERVGD